MGQVTYARVLLDLEAAYTRRSLVNPTKAPAGPEDSLAETFAVEAELACHDRCCDPGCLLAVMPQAEAYTMTAPLSYKGLSVQPLQRAVAVCRMATVAADPVAVGPAVVASDDVAADVGNAVGPDVAAVPAAERRALHCLASVAALV